MEKKALPLCLFIMKESTRIIHWIHDYGKGGPFAIKLVALS